MKTITLTPVLICTAALALAACDGSPRSASSLELAGTGFGTNGDAGRGDDTFDDTAPPVGMARPAGTEVRDCAHRLPCTWEDDDGGFTVTLAAVDNTDSAGRLVASFGVETAHDTTLTLQRASDVIASSGRRIGSAGRRLGTARDAEELTVIAAEPVSGSVTYVDAADENALRLLTLDFVDGGVERHASFTAVPVAPPLGEIEDCERRLPCTWRDADGRVTVTLDTAGGLATEGRVSVQMRIESAFDTEMTLAGGSFCVTDSGTRLDAISQSIGERHEAGAVSTPVYAGVPTAAGVRFARRPGRPGMLSRLRLALHESHATERLNPTFRNLPLQ